MFQTKKKDNDIQLEIEEYVVMRVNSSQKIFLHVMNRLAEKG